MLIFAILVLISNLVANTVIINQDIIGYLLIFVIILCTIRYYKLASIMLVFCATIWYIEAAYQNRITVPLYNYTTMATINKLSSNNKGYQVLLNIDFGYLRNNKISVACHISDSNCDGLVLGRQYKVNLNLYPLRILSVKYLENYNYYYLNNHIIASGLIKNYQIIESTNVASSTNLLGYIDRYRNYQINYLESKFATDPNIGVLIAILTGYQSYISPTTWQVFQQTNTVHMVSVSGLHLTIFAISFWLCIASMLRLFRYKYYRISVLNISTWLMYLATSIYACFCGMSMPTLRGLLSIYIIGMFVLLRSYYDKYDVYAIVLILSCVLLPFTTVSLGFCLSFAVVFLIFLTIDYVKIPNKWLKLLALQLIISVFGLMVVHYYNGSFTLYSLFANLLILFALNLILPIALLGMLLHFNYLLVAMLWVIHYGMLLLSWIADLPVYNFVAPNLSLLLMGVIGLACILIPTMLYLQKIFGICLIICSIFFAINIPHDWTIWINNSNYWIGLIRQGTQNTLIVVGRNDSQYKVINLDNLSSQIKEVAAKTGINRFDYVLTETNISDRLESSLLHHNIIFNQVVSGESSIVLDSQNRLSINYVDNNYTISLGNKLLVTSDIDKIESGVFTNYSEVLWDAKGYNCKDINLDVFAAKTYVIADYYWDSCMEDTLYQNNRLIDLDGFSDYSLH